MYSVRLTCLCDEVVRQEHYVSPRTVRWAEGTVNGMLGQANWRM